MQPPLADLPIRLDDVIQAARQAGDLIRQMRENGLARIQDKSSNIDLVTEADVASEKLLRQLLARDYPAIGFWGEESNRQPDDELFWVVDPIDGTTNFANGVPYYAVNIALCQRDGALLLGVTLEMPAMHLYWAVQGQGAFQQTQDEQQKHLQVNDKSQLGSALLATGFPYHRAQHPDNNLAEFNYFLPRAQGIRCMGSSALDLVQVASGGTCAYWEGWLQPWDAAPGVLMVREAGGKVTDYAGQPWTLHSKTLLASNGNDALHQTLLDGIRTARSQLQESLLD